MASGWDLRLLIAVAMALLCALSLAIPPRTDWTIKVAAHGAAALVLAAVL